MRPVSTPKEVEHLQKMIEDHVRDHPEFTESDVIALEEIVEVYKAVRILKQSGAWIGAAIVKMGSIATALGVLYLFWKGGK